MAMDGWDIVRFIGLPVLGLVGGWIGAAARIAHKVRELEAALPILKSGLKLEVDGHKDSMGLLVADLRRDLEKLERDIDRFRDSSSDYAKDAELAKFMMEVNDRWQQMQRTLGEIIGEMRAQNRNRSP